MPASEQTLVGLLPCLGCRIVPPQPTPPIWCYARTQAAEEARLRAAFPLLGFRRRDAELVRHRRCVACCVVTARIADNPPQVWEWLRGGPWGTHAARVYAGAYASCVAACCVLRPDQL